MPGKVRNGCIDESAIHFVTQPGQYKAKIYGIRLPSILLVLLGIRIFEKIQGEQNQRDE